MKIRAQFIITTIAFLGLLLIITASIASMNEQMDRVNQQEKLAGNIERGSDALNAISSEYFLYQQDSQINAWQSTHAAVSGNLSLLSTTTNSQQKSVVTAIGEDLVTLNSSFRSLVAFLQSQPRNVSVRVIPQFQNIWNAMVAQHQSLGVDSSQLSQLLRDEAGSLIQTNLALIVSLLCTFAAFFIITYFLFYRRTLISIANLQEGTNTIGSGNLDFRVKADTKDEVGDLSRSFNRMADNLKAVTASKVDLEREISERKKAEEELASSRDMLQRERDLLQTVMNASKNIHLVYLDRDFNFVRVNEEYARTCGYKPEEMIGKNHFALYPHEENEAIFKRVRDTGVPAHFHDKPFVFPDQPERGVTYWDWTLEPVKDEKGNVQGLVFSLIETTERKKAEAELQASEQRWATTLASIGDAVIASDTTGKITFMNAVAEELTGWSISEAFGKSVCKVFKIINEFSRKEVDDPISKVLKQGVIVGLANHTVLIRRHGGEVPIDDSGAPIRDEKGETTGVVLVFRDISERKKAEEKLEEYQKNLEKLVEERTRKLALSSLYARNLIEASLDPLVTISAEGKITDVNKATEIATGRSRDELIGSDFSIYFVEPEKAEIGYKRVFTEGIVKDYPLLIKHKNGKILEVLYNATIYRDESGEIQGVFAAARDITELKKAEQQAQEVAKKLKDSERLAAIGATAGMVGHDIRNPLQAITSDLYLAKTELDALPENEQKVNALESLNEKEHNIDYINKIVADLQDYARPLNPRAQETNVKSIFTEILAKNGVPKNIRVTVDVDDKAERIMVDPDYLKRIAANLMLNAVQAMPDGGKLTVRAYADKQTNDVVITVKDTGVGIPEDIKPKLFTPMMTTKSKGQGFGLAVVKRMTEALGGTVTFESQIGKGTKFILRFPPRAER